MPEALATSKRKFYRLLDNLNSPSSNSIPRPASTTSLQPTSFSTLNATSHASNKKSHASIVSTASAANIEPTTKRLRPSTSSTTIDSLRALHARNASRESIASLRSVNSPIALRDGGRVVPSRSNTPATPRNGSLSKPSSKRDAQGRLVDSASHKTSDEVKKAAVPHFSPWSHDAFLKRLKTFAPVTSWLPKPEGIGEVEWAKRGWVCVDTNTVGCRGGCGKRILVKLEPRTRISVPADEGGEDGGQEQPDEAEDEEDLDEQFERGLVEKYRALIVEGHAEGCLWRKTGCKADIYHLPVVRTAVWQPELHERYKSLLETSESISGLQLKTQDGAEPSPQNLLQDLPASLLSASEPSEPSAHGHEASQPAPATQDPETRALALRIALSGWTGTTESRTALLSCSACFQRIGLWMYQKDYSNKRRKTTASAFDGHNTLPASADANEDDDDDDTSKLDLVEMHREHCPWRNGASQAATGEYAAWPAWKILWRVVARFADESRRRRRSERLQITPTRDRAEGEDARVRDAATGTQEAGRDGEDGDEDDAASVMSRAEIQKADRERTNKLRKLKRMFSLKKRAPAVV